MLLLVNLTHAEKITKIHCATWYVYICFGCVHLSSGRLAPLVRLGFNKDWLAWLIGHLQIWEGVKGSFCCWWMGSKAHRWASGSKAHHEKSSVSRVTRTPLVSKTVGTAVLENELLGLILALLGLFFLGRSYPRLTTRASSSGHYLRDLRDLRALPLLLRLGLYGLCKFCLMMNSQNAVSCSQNLHREMHVCGSWSQV